MHPEELKMPEEEVGEEETVVPTSSSDTFGEAAESIRADSEAPPNKDQEEEEDGGDFEFALLCDDDDPEIAAADEIFLNGQIRPVYPLFDKDLFRLYQGGPGGERLAAAHVVPLSREEREAVRAPLRDLTRAEGDELDGIPAESYCLWTPGAAPPGMRRKSKSTGSSSLPWKLRDLVIGRSHSDGKKRFVFLEHAPPPEGGKGRGKGKEEEEEPKATVAEVHRLYYARADAATADRRRSYLPYRRDLVGFLAGGGFRP